MTTRADRTLLWLLIITLFLGGVGTLLVIFMADVLM